ncbi:LSU ribosomal protein L24P [Prosthecobacter debontii]|uniref:Large ribosomal subunit protein uL24 n=1 Tax=Prosthecobacter debontii TaxID=48467 RepID=A0A1T4YWW8_9BACT|nr:50S ribosomal protein L24 [Prosthecobacter debontii]SKB06262.1 LSU ribosomal protein L24P [Prosthecobacter debontii]
MSRIKTHVKKGDNVVVISGAHKGAQGTIIEVQPAKNRVLVEGVRMIKKTVKPSQERPNGGIVEQEGPIHISNVKVAETKAKTTKKKVAKK